MKQIDKSPIRNNSLEHFLNCKDYTVSGETFSIVIDKDSDFLITTPRPNDEDLGKYYESENYISHADSKKSFIDKIYQAVRSITIKQKVNLINTFDQTDKTILDIGVGTGDFLSACENSNWQVKGVEPNGKARILAKSKLKNPISKIYGTIEELELETFDVITMWHVLEHVPNLTEYISILKRLLKSNGTLVIAVPNFKSYDALHYKKYWAAFDVPRHLWHFSQRAIQKLFQPVRMKIIRKIPMRFDAYYVSLLSEKYKSGKSNIIKAFFVGLKSNFKARRSKEYSSITYIIKNS